ncbi:serine-threonine protein kinase, plant-type, putative [Ricinus communis]|uniref:Serine-threonine protein kinase, plant-type, putative n=1 Tax=Ricinus communis TaxID=3988 RepID=B9SUZ0_RICCO|nr:serine-threonine protein kinase, plant-type, putative [Ricinus communis]
MLLVAIKGQIQPCFEGFMIGYAVFAVSVTFALMACDIPAWMNFKIRSKNLLKIRSKVLNMIRRKRKTKIIDSDQVTDFHTVDNLQDGGKEVVTRLPYTDLRNATDNFSEKNIIGLGKMGIMFKATLPSGHFLAVKKLNYSQFLDEQFIAELRIPGAIRHINIIPIVGFCIKSKERLLVYKYMPNGRLYDWLHHRQDQVMNWPLRAKIAIGLARGLAWIHQGSYIRIIHLNISSKCILLDQSFEPKLSNFGEAIIMIPTKSSSENTEFWEMAFVKEDVYSFGIVLLELITGEDSSRMTSTSSSNSYGDSPSEWVSHLFDRHSSTSYDLIDESVSGYGFDDDIHQFLEIAFSCVQPVVDQRPTMLEVYEQIKDIAEKYSIINGLQPSFLLHAFIISLLGSFATETDLACIKCIKGFLEDPFGLKSSWDFNSDTEGCICRFTGVDCWDPDESEVLNLRVSDMGLQEQFPRAIENCTRLTGLDLSNKEVQGPIPFDILKILPFVTIDLSSNHFSASIANCSDLNLLKLDHNRLAGEIPPEIGPPSWIKVFSLSNNPSSEPVSFSVKDL